jgi:hypothetical protein
MTKNNKVLLGKPSYRVTKRIPWKDGMEVKTGVSMSAKKTVTQEVTSRYWEEVEGQKYRL